jgi:hypothetical protein
VRTDGPPVREDLTGVLEYDDAVAEQAPSLFGKGCDGPGGVVIGRISVGTLRLVLAHRVSPLQGVVTGGAGIAGGRGRCAVAHMTNHARYSVERRTFEQVTPTLCEFRPFG